MGLGIRAAVNIKSGTRLGVYAGRIQTGDESEDTGYLADLNWPRDVPHESQLVVDADSVGNVRTSYAAILSHMLTCVISGLASS
jgi:hypothetical protein